MHDFEIEVDVMGQIHLGELLGNDLDYGLGIKLPTFPLNTDGLDPAGRNILIERVNITNFDDAVAVKPLDRGNNIHCTENLVVRDCNVWWGVGMAIGSVYPSDNYRCIRNVTFKDINFYHPFKAIYVKTNSGDTSSMLPGSGGEITNIVYENIEINTPVWFGIYIGPQ